MSTVIHNTDCLDLLDSLPNVPLMFADPPDNLGLDYDIYKDKKPAEDYYNFLDLVIRKSLRVADCFWLSYYWEHDLEVKHRIRNIIKHERPSVKCKTLVWTYTFGQYNDNDFGSGFRFLARLSKPSAKFRPDRVRVPSRRMELGDARASGPRVPDDNWDFPRVTGNSGERRKWHPTQHPEGLMHRIIQMHSDPGDTVVDLFGGTGTTARVCEATERNCVISEISTNYAKQIAAENPKRTLILKSG